MWKTSSAARWSGSWEMSRPQRLCLGICWWTHSLMTLWRCSSWLEDVDLWGQAFDGQLVSECVLSCCFCMHLGEHLLTTSLFHNIPYYYKLQQWAWAGPSRPQNKSLLLNICNLIIIIIFSIVVIWDSISSCSPGWPQFYHACFNLLSKWWERMYPYPKQVTLNYSLLHPI